MAGRFIKMLFIGPLAIFGMILFAFIGGEIVQHLWNWLLLPLVGWPVLTFWQALGLLALCRILVGGFGWHRPATTVVAIAWALTSAACPPKNATAFAKASATTVVKPSANTSARPLPTPSPSNPKATSNFPGRR